LCAQAVQSTLKHQLLLTSEERRLGEGAVFVPHPEISADEWKLAGRRA
jgi:hypothetical protein